MLWVAGAMLILPGTGRWREATEGPHAWDRAVHAESWDPSAPLGHLPVPGRIWLRQAGIMDALISSSLREAKGDAAIQTAYRYHWIASLRSQ